MGRYGGLSSRPAPGHPICEGDRTIRPGKPLKGGSGKLDITPYISAIVTALIAAGGTYAAVTSRLARVETMIADLRRDVERHNNVIERTYALESDMNTAFKRIDELKQADLRLDEKKQDKDR